MGVDDTNGGIEEGNIAMACFLARAIAEIGV
jgi:hypothetical protein